MIIRYLVCLVFLAIGVVWTAAPSTAGARDRGFDSMSIEADDECRLPRPPMAIGETAYIRNGYRAILRILAAETWQHTGTCDCLLSAFTWEDVVTESERFITSDDPRRPFDVLALNEVADLLDAERAAACEAP